MEKEVTLSKNVILSTFTLYDFTAAIRECVKAELTGYKSNTTTTEEFITEKEAALFLRVSKATMINWRNAKIIKFHRINSRIRYTKAELIKASEIKKKYKKVPQ